MSPACQTSTRLVTWTQGYETGIHKAEPLPEDRLSPGQHIQNRLPVSGNQAGLSEIEVTTLSSKTVTKGPAV